MIGLRFMETLQMAFYIALPGAMFYIGSVLSRLGTRIDGLSEELDKLSAKWEEHLADHHRIMTNQPGNPQPYLRRGIE